MKKLATVLVGCALTVNLALFAENKQADHKWLATVQKMVINGEKKFSTPSEERAHLLKTWGEKKGYTVQVTKSRDDFSIELTP